MGYDIGTVDIHSSPRIGGSSSVKIIKDGTRTILLIFRIIMLFNPLKVFFPSGVFALILGVLLSILGISTYHRIPNSALILMTLSMFLFFFGLIADQISMLNFMEERDTFEPDENET